MMPLRTNRRILLGLLLTITLVFGGITLLTANYLRQQAQTRIEVTTQNLVRSIEQNIFEMAESVDVALLNTGDEMSRQLALGAASSQATSEFIRRQLQRQPDIAYIRGANERGDVIYGPGVLSTPNNIADRAYFGQLRNDTRGNLLRSQVVVGRIEGKWVWLFVRRINKMDGSFGGVVFAGVLLDRLTTSFSKYQLDVGGSIALRDAHLGLIARHVVGQVNPFEPGDTRLAKPFADALKANAAEGTYVSGDTSIDGINRTHSYRRNGKYDFVVNVGVSGDADLALWRQQTLVSILLLLAFTAGASAFAWVLQRSWRAHDTSLASVLASQQALNESEAHLKAIFENEPECIKIVDAQGRLVQMNPAGLAMFEADSLEQVQGIPMFEMLVPEYREAFMAMHRRVIAGEAGKMEFEVLGLKGGRRMLETHGVPMKVQAETLHLAVTRDITQRKQMEEQVRQLAFYDVLTELPNRRLLIDRLEQAMSASKRTGRYRALMFLDLDNFKALNDTHGHEAGDLLLIEVARRLTSSVREVDTVSRFGGDEFAILLSDLVADKAETSKEVGIIAEKISIKLAESYVLAIRRGDHTLTTVEHRCSASIGAVVFMNHECSLEDILRRADTAMYEAKNAGRNTVRFYESKDPT